MNEREMDEKKNQVIREISCFECSVKSFSQKNLWRTYNDITYQLSRRNLEESTRFSWSLKATKIFEDYIKEQA